MKEPRYNEDDMHLYKRACPSVCPSVRCFTTQFKTIMSEPIRQAAPASTIIFGCKSDLSSFSYTVYTHTHTHIHSLMVFFSILF